MFKSCPACGSAKTIVQATEDVSVLVVRHDAKLKRIINEPKKVIYADHLLCQTCLYQWKIDYLADERPPDTLPEEVKIPTYCETIKKV